MKLLIQLQTLAQTLVLEGGAAAQQTRAVRPRGLLCRLSLLQTRAENARLRAGTVPFVDSVGVLQKKFEFNISDLITHSLHVALAHLHDATDEGHV